MQGIEDPAIRLFGRKIPLPDADSGTCEVKWMEEEEEEDETGDDDDQGETEQRITIISRSQSGVQYVVGEGAEKLEISKSVKESSEASDSRGKTLKGPDKVLPCPRCDSMNTKFCYYNNYNVNQPRHFCRACQRYWTVGGSMRNMPVGAGRRKNKSAACRSRRIMVSGVLGGEKVGMSDCVRLPDFKSRGMVPGFGVDNGKPGNGSSVSSVAISKRPDRDGIPSQIQFLQGSPWSYGWNPVVPPPALFPAAAFWTCNIPLGPSHQSSSTDGLGTNVASSDSAITGKRSRELERDIKSPEQGNGRLLVPKTLRIHDPKEAAKSSIWSSLGIPRDSTTTGASSSSFKQKGVEKLPYVKKLPGLRANPAALSRSLNFRDNN